MIEVQFLAVSRSVRQKKIRRRSYLGIAWRREMFEVASFALVQTAT